MRVLVASDKFKGSLTAKEACRTIAEGLRAGTPGHEFDCVPIADGGDGLARILTDGAAGEWIELSVQGPLGDPVAAGYGILDKGKTAVIEMASASGIALVEEGKLDPWNASTFGTGQLIDDAMKRGVDRIILGIGGSATNDGGVGMAKALGIDVNDPGVAAFPAKVTVACDVENPLLGPDGCTRIYGPQKGITKDEFSKHEDRLAQLVSALGERGQEFAKTPGSGAAGGLGFGCLAFLGAELVPGFDLVANFLGLEEKVRAADLVITGEGKIDRQSLSGKGPAEVARMAQRLGKRRGAFCGYLEDRGLEEHFGPIYEIRDPNLTVEENMQLGEERLRQAAENAAPALFA